MKKFRIEYEECRGIQNVSADVMDIKQGCYVLIELKPNPHVVFSVPVVRVRNIYEVR